MEGRVSLRVACPICKLEERILVRREFSQMGRDAWKVKHQKQCKGEELITRREKFYRRVEKKLFSLCSWIRNNLGR